jgi:hypothetical protein
MTFGRRKIEELTKAVRAAICDGLPEELRGDAEADPYCRE